MMKILVVEDDSRMFQVVRRALQETGYDVRHAGTGPEGLELALAEPFDAAVVDVMLPGLDGLSLIRELRALKVATPVIVLSARSTVDDRVKGLEAGGDDYLVKPFALSELLARLQALMRRTMALSEPTQITVGPLQLDVMRHKVTCDGHEVELQPREYSLLEYLMRNAGRVVSKTLIMERVWEYNFDPQTNVVEARISRLRDKLERVSARKLIHTVRGVGYVLEARP
jgi:two-component system OmpR family response regulator